MVLTIIEVITLPSKSKLKMEESSTWVVKVYDVYHRKSKVDQQKKLNQTIQKTYGILTG